MKINENSALFMLGSSVTLGTIGALGAHILSTAFINFSPATMFVTWALVPAIAGTVFMAGNNQFKAGVVGGFVCYPASLIVTSCLFDKAKVGIISSVASLITGGIAAGLVLTVCGIAAVCFSLSYSLLT